MVNVGGSRPDNGHVLANIPVPVLLIAPDNSIAYANDASEAFFGRSRKRLEGQPTAAVLRFDSERMNNALTSSENDISAQDMELKSAHGSITVDINISLLPGETDWRIAIISPRHGGREHIGEQKDSGQQQAMGAPAILGHEIKNPLAGIKGAAQLLARHVDEKNQPLTELIVNEVDRIARLLDQMQKLSRSEEPELAPANVHLLIERAIRSLRAANRAMPELSINYDPSLPEVVIDADGMVQILINLLQNAVDALKGRLDGVIGISTRFVMSGALREADMERRTVKLPVEIAISDNGPGVPQHIEDELFSPFVTTKRDGQGLGLAIVRNLVQQMNSRIVFERDTQKERTVFRLFLPVASKKGET
ncbi:two-component system sensor histidine kinase NtrB [Sphingorhabdus contaminans]|uniref:histidine kinase n=1 Tax=Sphingorhabdus contaminans TaxID=1343899 RepID=A0A553WJ39_9SPHN|nr:ATP-binding protein [Sphingorhabdus contaminans]TSB04715.1 PAS domain-containing protein [Sphingorhabdus contaminans]